jgi:intraflagellar transport protein 74
LEKIKTLEGRIDKEM